MRLWSIHPKYLDHRGLVALWREALLARAVLRGETKGYTKHPQLQRFRRVRDPIDAINAYLVYIFEEAKERGYNFDVNKLEENEGHEKIPVTKGQVAFEFAHLKRKCISRSPSSIEKLDDIKVIETNPLFVVVEGDVESWERI